MIVVLDTTAISADALCGGDAWQTLIPAAPTWNVRIAVTEVTVAEAIANYGRDVEKAQAALQTWKHKQRLGSLGLPDATAAADNVSSVLAAGASQYEARLRARFKTADVNILTATGIPHMELVNRATARRRPCDDHGDGYRDTLNWLMVLQLAQTEPEERIIWVSENSKDFGDGSKDGAAALHPHLIEDLTAMSAQNRVSWQRSLADTVLALAAEHVPGNETDIKKVKQAVHEESVLAFIRKELPAAALERSLSPHRCGLPVGTVQAKLVAIADPRDLVLDVKNVLPDKQAVAEFTLHADAAIELQQVLPSVDTNTATSTRVVSKLLVFRGLATLDDFSRPTGVELAGIDALADDPGRQAWQLVMDIQHPAGLQEALDRLPQLRFPDHWPELSRFQEVLQNNSALQGLAEQAQKVTEATAPLREALERINQMLPDLRQMYPQIDVGEASPGPSQENPDAGQDDDDTDNPNASDDE